MIFQQTTNPMPVLLPDDSAQVADAFHQGLVLGIIIVVALLGFSFLRTIPGDNSEDL